MTDDEIKAAREMCADPIEQDSGDPPICPACGDEYILCNDNGTHGHMMCDPCGAESFDKIRTLVPRLLDEVERLRRELSEAHDIANDQIRQRTNLAAFVEGEAWRMAALRAVLADAMALLDTVNPDYSRDEWERLANRIAALKSKVAP